MHILGNFVFTKIKDIKQVAFVLFSQFQASQIRFSNINRFHLQIRKASSHDIIRRH